MARASGHLVMTGDKDGEFSMYVEFAEEGMTPHQLRAGGFYIGKKTSAEMIEELTKRASAGIDDSKPDVTGSIGNGVATESSTESTPFVEGEGETQEQFVNEEETNQQEMCPIKQHWDTEADDYVNDESEPEPEPYDEPDPGDDRRTSGKQQYTNDEPEPEPEPYDEPDPGDDRRTSGKQQYTNDEPEPEPEPFDEPDPGDDIRTSGKEQYTDDEPEPGDITAKYDCVDNLVALISGRRSPVEVAAISGGCSPVEAAVISGGRSPVGLQPHLRPFSEKPARAMGRVNVVSLRRDESSVDEVEVEDVDEFYVVGEDVNEPVSLRLLPLEVDDQIRIGVASSVELGAEFTVEFSLRGKSNGVDIMRPVSAWKLHFLEFPAFQILVKISQKSSQKWVKLGRPRSRFEESSEDAFFVAKVFALLKKEPQASEDRVWNYLLEGDASPEACRDRLRRQYPLMEQFISLDPDLKDSEALKTLLSLSEKDKIVSSGKRVLLDRDSSDEHADRPVKKVKAGNSVQKPTGFCTTVPADVSMRESGSDDDYYDVIDAYESDEEEEYGDSVCTLCDDGGELLCCDGPCMRSFHARVKDGSEMGCRTLRFTEAAVARLGAKWLCKNCKYKTHQCYDCGELGTSISDETTGVRQEVFVCNVAFCGRFYHPNCIASKLTTVPIERKALAENIQAGKETFTCSLHTCKTCGEGEDREVDDLSLVKCRRCPSSWHKKCLPKSMCFEKDPWRREKPIRVWRFGGQYICYCLDHKILQNLGTPTRDHVQWPPFPEEAKDLEKLNQRLDPSMKELFRQAVKPRPATTGRVVGKNLSFNLNTKPKPYNICGSSSLVSPSQLISKDTLKKSEEDAERIVLDIMNWSRQNVTEESLKTRYEQSLPGIYKPKWNVTKDFMKLGSLNSILEASRNAMNKIRDGKRNEAMTICSKQSVLAVVQEEERLRTYLAPTLYGRRYTSYGRHFTKEQKLDKAVEILEPYIWDNDTIVDFSCGDNSFCRLLRENLPKAGKSHCRFRNFDLFPSKDTFGFEQKDWFEVGMKECGPGDSLVIGLNPPFAFAEKFVSHALGMMPRILVLIIPPLKKNLEHLGYHCLVDDDLLMADKSFYLPGSVHEKNTETLEQSNHSAPHYYIYCARKFRAVYTGVSGTNVPELPEPGPSTVANLSLRGATMVKMSELKSAMKPSRPPQQEPNLFIPPPQVRSQAAQAPSQKAKETRAQAPQPPNQKGKEKKLKHTFSKRDPRQDLHRGAVLSANQVEDGEVQGRQRPPLLQKNLRPPWRRGDLLPGPPPGPPPHHVQQMHHFGGPAFRGQYSYRPRIEPGYSHYEPGLFPTGPPMLRGFRPPPRYPHPHGGFYTGPGPSPFSHREHSPGPKMEGDGGWLDR